jgi:N-acylneuraminate cytidylyltransferase
MVKKSLAVISARGGSKRIPYKNIIDFFGKPLIAWSIEAALESQAFDKVIVSTDDVKIADIAKQYGADVPFIRENYVDDFSPISLVVCDALNYMNDILGERYEYVAQIMPNCPIRDSKDIKNSYDNFIQSNYNFQLSCFEFGWMNPWWAFSLGENNIPKPLHEKGLKSRSQDLEKLYCPTGAIWLAKSESLLESKTFYGPDYRMFPISWQSAVDIDNYEDLDMAKAIYLLKKEKV